MTLESTIRKMQVQWIEESIDFDNLIESLDEGLDEGRMKELHGYIAKGMSAADIAKKMGLDVKTIEALMDDVELDEGKMGAAQIAKLKKAYEPMRGKKISMASGQKLSSIMDKVDDDKEALSQLVKADIPFVSQLAVTRLITKHGMKGAEIRKMQEEVELDEEVSVKDFDALKKGDTVTVEYKSAMSSGKGTFAVTAKNKVAKGKVEKVTLKSTKNPGGVKYFLYKRDNKVGFAQGDMGASVVSFKKEEVELDEAKQKPYVSSDRDGKHVMNASGEIAKSFKDMDSANAYLKKNYNKLMKEKLDERSAAAQARRDARGEFDDKPEKGDDVATDADKKRGDENIINQLRKALDNPKHEVRFADGKSEVVKPDIVKAALEIFMQLKSNDKRKLQPVYAKSAKSLTSIVNRLMKKAHYEGVEEMNEDFRTGRFGVSQSLVDAVKDIIMGKRVNETNKNDKSDDGEGLDAVQPKAVKKKFKDRKDKDIDNDGDVDDSDKFLHKRRKAISKAMDKKESKKIKEQDDDEDEKETAKKAKKDEPKKNGKEKVEVDPTLDEKLDEGSMKDKLIKTADLIQKMIKPGDPDRHDYAAARDHIEANNMKTLKKIVMNMDTEPKERIAVALAKGLGKAEAEKILGVELNMSEEIELDEAQDVTLPKGVGFYDTTNYPIGGKFDRVTDPKGLKVTVKRRFKFFKGTDAEGITDDGRKVAFRMGLATEETKIVEEVKEEMTEAQKEKREEIVKELKKKTEDFKKKYGDRWEDVMYATATKMAMKAA